MHMSCRVCQCVAGPPFGRRVAPVFGGDFLSLRVCVVIYVSNCSLAREGLGRGVLMQPSSIIEGLWDTAQNLRVVASEVRV